jgi:hypothetical protein
VKFSAVKHRFKPVSGAVLDELVRKHAGPGRIEQSVFLDEVGLEEAARRAVSEADRKPDPAEPTVQTKSAQHVGTHLDSKR